MPLDEYVPRSPPGDASMEERMRAVEDAMLTIKTLLPSIATKENLSELRGTIKTDLAELRGATNTDLAELHGELKAEILATKVALFDAMNAQTWKFIGWTTGIVIVGGGALVSATFYIARNVH